VRIRSSSAFISHLASYLCQNIIRIGIPFFCHVVKRLSWIASILIDILNYLSHPRIALHQSSQKAACLR